MRLLWRRPSGGEPDHELIWFAVSALALAAGATWLALALPALPWSRCPFLSVTGLPCVTCGATRSLIAFLRGDFLSALRWNPLAFVAYCSLIVFDLYAAVVLVGRMPRLRMADWSAKEKNAVRIAVIGLLALNWIYLLAHHGRY
jgi:hypothetical protein